ncbi:myogenesis-regulating glycosidase-like [Aplysia californica]|uniref:Myogenesis-regulating glycosidase-like n=1 Tax=Aplysia californica TaxID=6500 RepID=A0ABM0JQQ8_APLCA|nr:myogenesis-regulating glycosidase-like [Aplysia californica]
MSCNKRVVIGLVCFALMAVILVVVGIVLWRDYEDDSSQPEDRQIRLTEDIRFSATSFNLTIVGIPEANISAVTARIGQNVIQSEAAICRGREDGTVCRRWPGGRRLNIRPSVQNPGQYGDVIEPIFLSSAGVGIHVDETTPLYVSINEAKSKQLCLVGRTGANTPYYHGSQSASLRYDVCKSKDIASLWKAMAEQFIPKPAASMSDDVLRNPIWCTWAKYKGGINQTLLLEYASLITDNEFPASQIEIDDEWTPKYGDLVFATDKFPDARELIQNLTSEGFPITVWVHPFFNVDSQAFQELSEKNYLVRALHSEKPALTEWWRGKHAGHLDVTNPDAVSWYLDRLDNLKVNYNVTSFKFDAGETKWLPAGYETYETLPNPSVLTRKYVEMAYRSDVKERRQEVRAGYRSQNSSTMVRMLDRASNWSHRRGLKTVIPCALAFGIMGYPFVLPDLIGGNAMDNITIDHTVLPDKELYIRWMEATTFLPVLQFSVGPWDYDEEVVNITRKYVQLHQNFSDLIVNLSKEAVVTGHPIVRPLWWTDPTDQAALTLDTQFLLGNDLLVAPVLEQGAESRDIYILNGDWRDELRGDILSGPQWLYNYTVALHELAYFTRVTA